MSSHSSVRPCHRFLSRGAFTLVELLVVITIIGILMSLLLPAVQAARERGRRNACKNNLRQLGVAVQSHLQTTGRFPTGGWGRDWVGDPDMGTTPNQPGGWLYNILPFMEQTALHDMGAGLGPAAKATKNAERLQFALPDVMCPSRRVAVTRKAAQPKETDTIIVAAKSDYAINAGAQPSIQVFVEPSDRDEVLDGTFAWADTSLCTGISFQRSEIKDSHVIDGLTYTYLIGEKSLDPKHYETGLHPSDDQNMFAGYGDDNYRTTYSRPRQDTIGDGTSESFGSSHFYSFSMLFCDGRVSDVSYDIEPQQYLWRGSRGDQNTLDDSKQ